MDQKVVEWVMEHLPPFESDLRQLLRRVCSRSDEIEDVIQVMYDEILAMDSLEHVLAPRPFLVGVAKSVFLMRLRRGAIVNMGCVARLEAVGVEETVPSAASVASARPMWKRLPGMIANVPRWCKQGATRGLRLARRMMAATTTLPSMAWYEPGATLAENIDLYDDAMRRTADAWYRQHGHEGRPPCRQAGAQDPVHCTRCRRHPAR